MHPPLSAQAGGGSRGGSTAAGPAHHHSQSTAPSSHNGVSHCFDDSAILRWLQSAGLQHLATPLSAATHDHHLLPNLSIQDHVQHSVQSPEKPKLLKPSKIVPHNTSDLTKSSSGISTVTKQSEMQDLLSHELRFDSSPGIFDIHAIDTELLSEEAALGWGDSGSPFVPVIEQGFENDLELESCKHYSPSRLQSYTFETLARPVTADKEKSVKDNGPAKIKVVVRKRPINKKELARGEEDIICVAENGCSLTVHEPKLKVDLTAYVERHEFVFDAILDQNVTNDEVYLETVEPIIPTLFQRTKATCFAYGQTGSGKTYTMQPLPLKASEAILYLMQQPSYTSQGFQLWLSFFEIYGGKLFDLLNDRSKLCMREDGRQQVCIVGLKEFQIFDLETLKDYIERGSSSRSTGTTGANEESSRSHAILQLSIKQASDTNAKKLPQMVGKLSFIDLAGSERGADTTDNDRQTRLEGAEINKSLLALKECIRALDSDQGHIPFRGSKLTEVLRDSFVGDSRTVMISCISPSSGSCEHTLNTLRYADRVKGLSKNNNSKKDLSSLLPAKQECSALPLHPYAQHTLEGFEEPVILEDVVQTSRQSIASAQLLFTACHDSEQYQNLAFNDALDDGPDGMMGDACVADFVSNNLDYWQHDKVNVPQPPSWKVTRETEINMQSAVASKDDTIEERPRGLPKPNISSCSSSYLNQASLGATDRMSALLKEEDDLVSTHCKALEDTINFVREEMKLLVEVEQPGSQINQYVSQLSKVLSKKAAGLVNLQAHLAKFQKLLKEQEILGLSTGLQPV